MKQINLEMKEPTIVKMIIYMESVKYVIKEINNACS